MNMDSPMPGDFWYETAGLKISHFLQSFLRESGMASWSLVRASEQRHDPGKNCTNCKSCIFQSDSISWRITHYELLSNPSPWPKSEQNKKNALDLTLKSHRPIWATTSEFQGSVQSPYSQMDPFYLMGTIIQVNGPHSFLHVSDHVSVRGSTIRNTAILLRYLRPGQQKTWIVKFQNWTRTTLGLLSKSRP